MKATAANVWRRISRRPVTAFAAVASIALAVGVETSVISAVEATVVRALSFEDPNALVVIGNADSSSIDQIPRPASLPEFLDWKELGADVVLQTSAVGYQLVTLEGPAGRMTADGAYVTEDLFPLLGVPAALGRTLVAADYVPGHEHVVVVSDSLWRSAFAKDPSAVGRTIRLGTFSGQEDFRVVGVLPASFQLKYPKGDDVYVPQAIGDIRRDGSARRAASHVIYARLRSGVDLAQARARFAAVTSDLRARYPDARDTVVRVAELSESMLGRQRQFLSYLLAASFLVLVVACANVACLSVSDVAARAGEISVRLALGASRADIAWQFGVETAALVLAGGLMGCLLAGAGVRLFAAMAPAELARIDTMALDWHVLIWAAGMTVASAAAAGVWPALHTRRALSWDLQRSDGRAVVPAGSRQRALMSAQFAVVLALLAGAAMVLGVLYRLSHVSLGFDPRNISAVRLRFEQKYYGPKGYELQQRLVADLRQLPGVVDAGWTSELPLLSPSDAGTTGVRLEDGRTVPATYRLVDAHYLPTLRAHLRAGRFFDERSRSGTREVIINETLARRLSNTGDAVGRRVMVVDWYEVRGVVADLHEGRLHEPVAPAVYLPFDADRWNAGAPWLLVSGERVAPSDTVIRLVIAHAAPDVPVMKSVLVDQLAKQQTASQRFLGGLLVVFSATSLLLACVGLFGLGSHLVRQRRREFALRLALGATRRDVMSLVWWQVTRTMLWAVGVGTIVAVLLERWLRTLVIGAVPMGIQAYVAMSAFLVAVSLLATLAPARQASQTDPARALQSL